MLESFHQAFDNVAKDEPRGLSRVVSMHLDERDSKMKKIEEEQTRTREGHEVSLPLHRAELDKLLRVAVQEIMAVEMDKAIQRAGLLNLGPSLAAILAMANETNRSTSQLNRLNEVNASTRLPAATIANQDH